VKTLGPYSRAVARAAVPAALPAPVPLAASGLSVEERGGLWCVVTRDGANLAPCASREVAERHAAAISRHRPA
jgi:hypothetical protein